MNIDLFQIIDDAEMDKRRQIMEQKAEEKRQKELHMKNLGKEAI